MNKWIALLTLMTIIFVPGCAALSGETEAKNIPIMATGGMLANGSAGESGKINDITPVPVPEERRDLTPTVPRVKQAQVIGVVRELVRSGCVIKKVANTDGIHYSQLIITCGEPQAAPAIQ